MGFTRVHLAPGQSKRVAFTLHSSQVGSHGPGSTYTVQPGDTLWSIVYDIYGDVDRMEEFSQANIDQVPSPDAIRVGDELRVPPLE